MTMAEKMARAMFPWAWDRRGSAVEHQRDKQETLSKAILALEAMREPSDAMIDAIGGDPYAYEAMIAAAILEAKQ